MRRAGEGMLFPYTILFSFLFLRLRLKWLMGLKDYRGYFYGLMWVREERSCKLGPVCKLKRETVLGREDSFEELIPIRKIVVEVL